MTLNHLEFTCLQIFISMKAKLYIYWCKSTPNFFLESLLLLIGLSIFSFTISLASAWAKGSRNSKNDNKININHFLQNICDTFIMLSRPLTVNFELARIILMWFHFPPSGSPTFGSLGLFFHFRNPGGTLLLGRKISVVRWLTGHQQYVFFRLKFSS